MVVLSWVNKKSGMIHLFTDCQHVRNSANVREVRGGFDGNGKVCSRCSQRLLQAQPPMQAAPVQVQAVDLGRGVNGTELLRRPLPAGTRDRVLEMRGGVDVYTNTPGPRITTPEVDHIVELQMGWRAFQSACGASCDRSVVNVLAQVLNSSSCENFNVTSKSLNMAKMHAVKKWLAGGKLVEGLPLRAMVLDSGGRKNEKFMAPICETMAEAGDAVVLELESEHERSRQRGLVGGKGAIFDVCVSMEDMLAQMKLRV